MPWKLSRDYNMADFQAKIWLLFNGKLVLLFQSYNIILYVHAFLLLVAATTSCITYKPSPCDLENLSNDAKGKDE